MVVEKSRYFTFLLYPESIPNDWIERLESMDIPMAISPLHDRDKSKMKGQEFKKQHYHVLYIANNPVTSESVRLKIKRLLGDESIAKVQIIATSVENCYLYLTHESKDAIAKNKHIYEKSKIKHLNNFDIDRYIVESAEDKEDLYNLICDLIDEHCIANIRELRRFIEFHGQEYGIKGMRSVNAVLRAHTGLIRLYFDAVYQERTYGSYENIKIEAGEVLTKHDYSLAEKDENERK